MPEAWPFYAVLMIEVEARLSRGVVAAIESLFKHETWKDRIEVIEAAPVCSDVDVVVVVGAKDQATIGEAIVTLMAGTLPDYEAGSGTEAGKAIHSLRPYMLSAPSDSVLAKPSPNGVDDNTVDAFVIIHLSEQVPVPPNRLVSIQRVSRERALAYPIIGKSMICYGAPIVGRPRVFVRIRAPSKKAFDAFILKCLQEYKTATATRTYVFLEEPPAPLIADGGQTVADWQDMVIRMAEKRQNRLMDPVYVTDVRTALGLGSDEVQQMFREMRDDMKRAQHEGASQLVEVQKYNDQGGGKLRSYRLLPKGVAWVAENLRSHN